MCNRDFEIIELENLEAPDAGELGLGIAVGVGVGILNHHNDDYKCESSHTHIYWHSPFTYLHRV